MLERDGAVGSAAAVVSGRAWKRSQRNRRAAEKSRHQERAAQRHHTRHSRGGGIQGPQGHDARNILRLHLRARRQHLRRRDAAEIRPHRLSVSGRARHGKVLLRHARISRVGLARRFFRLPALQPRPSHREFPARCQNRDPSYRLRGARLVGHQARQRHAGEKQHQAQLGATPPHHRPQHRDLSQESGWRRRSSSSANSIRCTTRNSASSNRGPGIRTGRNGRKYGATIRCRTGGAPMSHSPNRTNAAATKSPAEPRRNSAAAEPTPALARARMRNDQKKSRHPGKSPR